MISTSTLPEFFFEKVENAASKAPVKVSVEAEHYIVNLLTAFCPLDNNQDQALALRFLEALVSTSYEKAQHLKKLGDASLFISGFFAESLNRKLVDIDYYISMGHAAYSNLSNLNTVKPLKNTFHELAQNFIIFVDIIAAVRDSTPLMNHQDVLNLYDRWLKTGSTRNKDLLEQHGIVPNALVKNKYPQ
ncbi:hypothetical protein K1X76_12085 [bacterium]|nr:hypothetical protein [bacterium]